MIKLWQNRRWAWPLWPASKLFEAITRSRHRAYRTGRKSSTKLPATVISVGNITVGGTGKTPTVIALAEALRKRGHRVAIISRGYGRKSHGVTVVSDGVHPPVNVHDSGDEPALLARRLPGIPVVVGADRAVAGQLAIDEFQATHLIADDAFQHLKLQRDADLLVMDATRPLGNGWLLPAGPLRDPLKRLSEATAVLLTRTDQSHHRQAIDALLKEWTEAPVFISSHRPACWVNDSGEEITKPPRAALWAFSGIAHPASFRATLEKTGVVISGLSAFKDHHWYTASNLEKVCAQARSAGAKALVTTEKDAVRLPADFTSPLPIWTLRIEIAIDPGIDPLLEALCNAKTGGTAL